MRVSFRICSVNISRKKGTIKEPVENINLIEGFGIEGDAHGGDWHRQISLLAVEDIEFMKSRGFELNPGSFAENITTKGIELHTLPVGTVLYVGKEAVLEVTQIGKECHGNRCAIFQLSGDCVMPKRGIFAKVLKGGNLNYEDSGYYDIG